MATASNQLPPTATTALSARTFMPVDLAAHLNNVAFTTRQNLGDGELNVWGNSLPAGTLGSDTAEIAGIPFAGIRSGPGMSDNVRCAGQYVELPACAADWLHLLAASERRCEDIAHVHYGSGAVDPEWLRVSDFWPGRARFGEVLAARSTAMHYPHHRQEGLSGQVWAVRVPVTRREPLCGLRLPDNPALHVFGLTVEWVE